MYAKKMLQTELRGTRGEERLTGRVHSLGFSVRHPKQAYISHNNENG